MQQQKNALGERVAGAYYGTLGKIGAASALSMAALPAFAQAELTSGVADVVEDGSAQMWILGGIVVGLCIIGFVIGRVKRQAS